MITAVWPRGLAGWIDFPAAKVGQSTAGPAHSKELRFSFKKSYSLECAGPAVLWPTLNTRLRSLVPADPSEPRSRNARTTGDSPQSATKLLYGSCGTYTSRVRSLTNVNR